MYSRRLLAIHMGCYMYRKRVILDVYRKKCQKYLEIFIIILIFAKYYVRFYNMKRYVYVVFSSEGVEAFSNLSKVIRFYSSLSYSKVYRGLLSNIEVTIDGYRVIKLSLR